MKIVRLAPRFSDPEEALRKFCAKSLRVPYSVELLYLPFVLFKYEVETTPFFGEKKAAEGLFLVDMIQGIPMNIRKETAFAVDSDLGEDFASFFAPHTTLFPASSDGISNGKNFLIETYAAPDSQVLPPALGKEEAVVRGKALLRYDVMRLAGGLRYRRLEITVLPEMKIIHYPFWLIYHRRRGEMRFSVLDGITGKRESDDIVSSIKKGLMIKHGLNSNFIRSEGVSRN